MPTPDFILELRAQVGHDLLWLPGVTAVVLRDERGQCEVLLVRRSDNGAWTPVTGIVDPDEQPAVAAVREVAEETGVRAVAERLARVHTLEPMTYPNGDRAQYLDLTFCCRYDDGTARVGDEESTEVGWYALDALPPISAEMQRRIEAAVHGPAEAVFEA